MDTFEKSLLRKESVANKDIKDIIPMKHFADVAEEEIGLKESGVCSSWFGVQGGYYDHIQS